MLNTEMKLLFEKVLRRSVEEGLHLRVHDLESIGLGLREHLGGLHEWVPSSSVFFIMNSLDDLLE